MATPDGVATPQPTSGIRIHINDYCIGRKYTSSKPISGHVKIQLYKDTEFDLVQICLFGTSATQVDGIHSPFTRRHTFLKLEMPTLETVYPTPRIYRAGQIYSIPFDFVVPYQLTTHACNHKVDSNTIYLSHLCLPPSMGSTDRTDDFSTKSAVIRYNIAARLLGPMDCNRIRMQILEATHSIDILPHYPELPPSYTTYNDKVYQMSKSKNFRKSFFTGTLGRITATTTQPKAVMLASDGTTASKSNVQIQLGFEPASSKKSLPRVACISSKITAMTYYCAGTIASIPDLGNWLGELGSARRALYPISISLPDTKIGQCEWQQQAATTRNPENPLETQSAKHDDDPNHQQGSEALPEDASVVYIASLQIPIELPIKDKIFLPSFYSCSISRSYILRFNVKLLYGDHETNVTLSVPLQIGVESEAATSNSRRTRNSDALLGNDAEDAALGLGPLRAQSADLPPSYAELMER